MTTINERERIEEILNAVLGDYADADAWNAANVAIATIFFGILLPVGLASSASRHLPHVLAIPIWCAAAVYASTWLVAIAIARSEHLVISPETIERRGWRSRRVARSSIASLRVRRYVRSGRPRDLLVVTHSGEKVAFLLPPVLQARIAAMGL